MWDWSVRVREREQDACTCVEKEGERRERVQKERREKWSVTVVSFSARSHLQKLSELRPLPLPRCSLGLHALALLSRDLLEALL